MKLKHFCLSVFCTQALFSCAISEPPHQIRIATFNVAMGLQSEGELLAKLESGSDPALTQLAEILQRVRPDIILLNEFDYMPGSDLLLRRNYLEKPAAGLVALQYTAAYMAPVNTGIDSGLDFNNNGKTGDPEDAWGFGNFPGQYGMLVLSRFPINTSQIRSFQNFLWSDMPGALQPMKEDGSPYYPEPVWQQLRLSSKSHWDLPISVNGSTFHFLVSHPTPTVFDGPEDRNGKRNHDENRLWSDYIKPQSSSYLYDDLGENGSLEADSKFVIAGDLNADPVDGNWMLDSIGQLLSHPGINASCVPQSQGGKQTSETQGGMNFQHKGDPASDTSDFNDEFAGNLRIDYLLPSNGLKIVGCGVYWPAEEQAGHELVAVSDHRLIWLDIEF
ncbi:MAG: endonuclease/exonuclease/phosphatase family metal-dependent hydrolase [Lysobacterales bacterium]|jgi:endonuclease/exonuclease/phosphatase family metal-dependent hydrolase